MPDEDKKYARQLIGKSIVTKNGKRIGEVGNITFETRTGELIYIVIKNPTNFTAGLELEKDKNGNFTIPFSSVLAVGDFLVVAEEDII